ncbi:FAS1-like dehydratase domain-containing protein [Pseudonocardia sp. GCM10023141]|uniref:FAS1-like dehydratase domain-containing protein n=1 Tax=Pseudonocardia sp. GCM10023141 TaxID=3252653 RepID=UPI00361FA98F
MAVERFPVEAGHVLMFRRAIGDERETDLAPPTFVQASAQFDPEYRLRPRDGVDWWGSAAGPGAPPAGAGGGGGGLHAEQHYTYHRPVRVGDVLHATVREGERWEKVGRSGTLKFFETITEYHDESGELVVTARGIGVLKESS